MSALQSFAVVAVSALGTLALAQAPAEDRPVDVGSRPEFKFRDALLNGGGVASLDDLEGRPTLVEFWGTR